MARKNDAQHELLSNTYLQLIYDIERRRQSIYEMIDSTVRSLRETFTRRFETMGGCMTCRGRGWVVTWDTLDFMDGSAACFGDCPNEACTKETRERSGLDLSSGQSKYDRIQGTVFFDFEKARSIMVAPFLACVRKLDDELVTVREMSIVKKGSKVIVFKGRKVPIGTIGTVVWIGDSTWGARVGVKVGEDVKWLSASNVAKLRE